jgi:hypothetical protein
VVKWAQQLGDKRIQVHNEKVGRELYRLVMQVSSMYRVGVFIGNEEG